MRKDSGRWFATQLSDSLNWDDVRVFLAIARAGQILAAARRLGMDHATASRHLTALEKSLGARLVERRTSGCLLTEAGNRLFEVAERVESELLHAQSELTNSGLSVSGTVTVSVPESFGSYFLAPQLAELIDTYSELSVVLLTHSRGVSLSRREADLAFTLERPEEGRLAVRKLVDYRSALFAHRDLVDERGSLRRDSIPLVSGPEDAGPAAPGIEAMGLRGRLRCATISGQLAALVAGVGVGILPAFVARSAPALVRVNAELDFESQLHIVTHLDVRDIRRVQEVHRLILRRVREEAAFFA